MTRALLVLVAVASLAHAAPRATARIAADGAVQVELDGVPAVPASAIGALEIPVTLDAPVAPPLPKLPAPPRAPRIPWFLVGVGVAFTLLLLALPMLLIRHHRAARRR